MELEEAQACVLGRLRQFEKKGGARRVLSEFVHSESNTIRRWVKGQNPPRGINLIKLWFFFKELGYPSAELDELHPYILQLAELVAYEVITVDEARELIGYKNTQQVWTAFRGGSRTILREDQTRQALLAEYGEDLAAAKLLYEFSRSASAPPDDSPEQVPASAGGTS